MRINGVKPAAAIAPQREADGARGPAARGADFDAHLWFYGTRQAVKQPRGVAQAGLEIKRLDVKFAGAQPGEKGGNF